ncbi:MAG: methyltransferase domain-containing protein [Pseudomonadota bacterium]
MHPDVVELLQFYRSVTGTCAKRVLFDVLETLWNLNKDVTLCGVGYTDPFLDIYHKRDIKCIALQSAYSGIYTRSHDNHYLAALVHETELPLEDASQNHILCAHLLEHTYSPDLFMGEISRVLSPQGEVIFIVPNRRGLWARFEHTPFGSGQPYTISQLRHLCESHSLLITEQTCALFFPPKDHPPIRLYVNLAEYIGRKSFLSHYGGVHIIKAVKRAYIPPKLHQPSLADPIKILSGRLAPTTRKVT